MNLLPALRPHEVYPSEHEQRILYYKAHAMASKLSNMTWADRDIGLQEWTELVDALNRIHASSQPEQKG